MATGCNNLNTGSSSSSSISSIHTYKLTKQQQLAATESKPKPAEAMNEPVGTSDSNEPELFVEHTSQTLRIKTKSIENTLLPLVNQVTVHFNLYNQISNNYL